MLLQIYFLGAWLDECEMLKKNVFFILLRFNDENQKMTNVEFSFSRE